MDYQTRFFLLLAAIGVLIVVLLIARWRQNRQSDLAAEENKAGGISSPLRQLRLVLTDTRRYNPDDDDDGLFPGSGSSLVTGIPMGRSPAAIAGAAAYQAAERGEDCRPDNDRLDDQASSDVCVPDTDDQAVETPDQGSHESGGFDSNN